MIETERLVLRDWREEDAEPLIRHTNTPAVMRWLGGVQTEEVARQDDRRPGHALAARTRLHLLGRRAQG
jgi:RimJ/RimL family protein N-acetyltransferase